MVSPVACDKNFRMINQSMPHAACYSATYGLREAGMHYMHAKMLQVALVALLMGRKDENPPTDRIRTRVNV
jgi:hypothetical protein